LALAAKIDHAPTLVAAHSHAAIFEMIRLDASAAKRYAEAGLPLAREHNLKLWTVFLPELAAWAHAYSRRTPAEWERMRAGVEDLHAQGIVTFNLAMSAAWLAWGLADAGRIEEGLAIVDQAIAEWERLGICWFDAESHRIRGEILSKRDPANIAPVEDALLTAIAIAQQQKARSFELRAALSLAKIYQSAGRAKDAHVVLAPALEGFSPTPELPEIAEAQTLLAELAETDEVKNAAASRQRRLQLQTAYGRAVAWSRGHSAEETKAAFARAREIAAGIDDPDERFATYYGQWIGSLVRGELLLARETAETFRHEAEDEARTTEVAIALHWVGMTCLWQGELTEAEAALEEARRRYDPERDREAKFRFGIDTGAGATHYLAQVKALLGRHGRARELIEEAVVRANESGHVPTRATAYQFKALFETLRDDAEAAQREAEILLQLSQQYGLALFLAMGALTAGWAHARRGQLEIGAAELRQALAEYAKQGASLFAPFYQGLLAEIEAEGGGATEALTQIDEALALAAKMGARWTDALLHRIRGEILLKRDPSHAAPAEEAFLTAIAIAQQQKARSFELRAALSLASLYQSTSRAADAHSVLAPALEGFSPTPEFPEIEEPQRLLGSLGS
jgi:predicted ATPase